MGAKIDMTGWKMWEHGVPNSRLTILNDSGKRGNGGIIWNCICQCGNKTAVGGALLRNGNTKSCGCLDAERIIQRNHSKNTIQIGKKYGLLTVIDFIGFKYATENSKKRRSYYLCQCQCGNYTEATSNQLSSKTKISCGCLSSKGEKKIIEILNRNNILFEYNKSFQPMNKDINRKLRFDFIIYNNDNTVNRFVEFDGIQHKVGMVGGYWSHAESLETIKERDNLKNQWCLDNNYTLIRIPYSRLEKLCLEDILGNKYIYKGDD